MLLSKQKRIRLFIAISVILLSGTFFTLCVSADGYIEEINCPSNIPVPMGSVFNLKDVTSVYPSSDELKSSLRYYSYDTDVATINSVTGIIMPQSIGRATIMISSDECTEFITINVCYPLSGGELELNNQTYLLWDRNPLLRYANCYNYALNAHSINYNLLDNAGDIDGLTGKALGATDTINVENLAGIIMGMKNDINYILGNGENIQGNSNYDNTVVELLDINDNFNCSVTDPNQFSAVGSSDYYRIVLFRSTCGFRAQHWMRQNSDGTWSHKLGTNQCISNFDASGNVILDPLTCNMQYTDVGDLYDYEYVACFLVKTAN